MADEQNKSMLLFGGLMTAVLLVSGYLAWRLYDTPVDPDGAGLVATTATEVVVRAGGGDAAACPEMQSVSAADEADSVVERCQAIAANAGSGGVWLAARDLHVTEVEIGRSSGTVTVVGTLLTRGPSFDMTFTWPVSREDGRWTVSDGPDVDAG